MSIIIEDFGIIFYLKRYKNNSSVVKIISKNNNIITGIIFNKNIYNNQIGNYIYFHYNKRNESEIGNLDIDLIEANSDLFFRKKINIAIINSSVFFINFFLIENNNLNKIYKTFFNLIFSIKYNNSNHLLSCYFDFIISLFDYLGINFNPYVCTITNSKNTYYISPKTGNAVIQIIGDKYKDKLFVIPKIIKEFYYEKYDIIYTLQVFYYFLEKFMINNNLFYLKKDFNFLKQTLFFIIKKMGKF